MLTALDPEPAGLHAAQAHRRVFEEPAEDAHRVRTSADARDDDIRQAAETLEMLGPRLASDHRLELAHHRRVRMRSDD